MRNKKNRIVCIFILTMNGTHFCYVFRFCCFYILLIFLYFHFLWTWAYFAFAYISKRSKDIYIFEYKKGNHENSNIHSSIYVYKMVWNDIYDLKLTICSNRVFLTYIDKAYARITILLKQIKLKLFLFLYNSSNLIIQI